MPVTEKLGRRQAIPFLFTRGTHYEVGFDVGRTFSALINSFVDSCGALNKEFLPAYETPKGRKIYDETLENLNRNFPQYVEELQGTSDGAKVPFHKLFLLHLDNLILCALEGKLEQKDSKLPSKQCYGCSTICLNENQQEILGHTEDALSDTLNHFYFVSAEIITEKPRGRYSVKEEKFTSLCYAGHLPGYTMSYNHHGLVFSINTVTARDLAPGKTPRHFLTRALLSAENLENALEILRDGGCGAGDGCSVNLTFLKDPERVFYNVEMAPAVAQSESPLQIVEAKKGQHLLHTNSYLRFNLPQSNIEMLNSSDCRLETFQTNHTKPKIKKDICNMLGDASNKEHPVFRDFGDVRTIAVGIFDCFNKTWTIYSDNPARNEPLVVLPLLLKN